MFQMRPYADAEGELDLPSFQDAIAVSQSVAVSR